MSKPRVILRRAPVYDPAAYVSSDFARKKVLLWWFPYRDPKPKVIQNALRLLHQDGMGGKLKASLALLPSLSMVRAGVSFKSLLKIAARFFRR